MPQIQAHSVHVNKLLTNVQVRYKNVAYINEMVAPIIDVNNETDYYAEWPKDVWFRNEVQKRAQGTAAARISLNITLTSNYQCEEYALATVIPDRVKRNADSQIKLQARLTELLVDKLMLAREVRVATLINTSGSWDNSTTLTGGDQWNQAGSDPIAHIDTAKATVDDAAPGAPANVMVIGELPWRTLRRHTSLMAFIFGPGFSGTQIITPAMVAAAFELDAVYVGRAMQIVPTTTVGAEKPTDYATPTKIWGDYCWIGHVNKTPSPLTPTAMHQFRWFSKIRSWFNDEVESDFIEAAESMDEKVVAKPCGYLISDCVA